jgi:hypothetical protein
MAIKVSKTHIVLNDLNHFINFLNLFLRSQNLQYFHRLNHLRFLTLNFHSLMIIDYPNNFLHLAYKVVGIEGFFK